MVLFIADNRREPKEQDIPMTFFPGNAFIKPQRRGIVLIVGSDTNPIASILCPLALAVAAGNGVLVRPSSAHPKCAKVTHKFINDYLDNRFYHCFTEQSDSAEVIAKLPIDMICFSGDKQHAIKILRAASNNLVPVHLEIETLAPVIIDASIDLKIGIPK